LFARRSWRPGTLTQRPNGSYGTSPGRRNSTLTDWRFGERSDIDEITREEAKRFAESVNLGQFVK